MQVLKLLLNADDLATREISNLNCLQVHCSISTELVYFYIKKAASFTIPKENQIELFNSFKNLQTAVFFTYPFSLELLRPPYPDKTVN